MKNLIENTRIMLPTGGLISLEQWQKQYGLKAGSFQVGRHFGLDTDSIFQENIKDYGQVVVCAYLIQIMDILREETNTSVVFNSMNRSDKKQMQLIASGERAATISPHVVLLAVDVDTKTDAQTLDWVKRIKEIAKKLGIKVRVGYKLYMKEGKTFIHLDVCPMYYAKGMPWNANTHPSVWEQEISW